MALHQSNPANFAGPGGQDYNVEAFKEATLRAELVELASQCCLEHSAKLIDKILADYKVTPKHGRKYG